MLKNKKIVLGVTGSIAAYKACLLVRALIKKGAEVQVVITPAGRQFVTPVTFAALTGKPVVCDFFAANDGTWHSHVDLGLWADAMVVAPCTASTLAKMTTGVADNMLVTTYLSMKAPIFVAPAMDLDMYAHTSTQANLSTLKSRGVHIIDAESGFLASGLTGKGRMAEPNEIVDALDKFFDEPNDKAVKAKSLSGKTVMITAGPTYEKIDPVRFIGNYSSGKMGFALAEECYQRGAQVILISGPVALKCSNGIKRIDVESCREMFDAATQHFGSADISILAAAVADYRIETVSDTKIKRHDGEKLQLTLTPNPDIAAELGRHKQDWQRLITFALETDNEIENAQTKMAKKNADLVIVNSLRNKGTCFGGDNNQISIISSRGVQSFGKKTKNEVAADIIDAVENII